MFDLETPLGPRQFDFTSLSNDDFELLSYLVVLLEFPAAVRLHAPDLGADHALPEGRSRDYARCWQAKRFTGHIHWGQCCSSLDAAVKAYEMPHYTYCFARDLTGNQERVFKHRLVGRHDGVVVDYWNASWLVGALLSSPQGERIANHFYGDPMHNSQALMQAIRAAGPFETGADVADKMRAVAEWLAAHDPFFSYPASTRETQVAGPGATPGAVIAIEEIGPDVTQRLEAVPRNNAAMAEYGPAFALLFETTEEGLRAREMFERSFESGEQVTISEGVSLRFDRLPPLMQAHVTDEPLQGVEVTISPLRSTPPARWPAHIVASSDAGEGQIDIDLEPVEPPEGWHGALEGSCGGLTATLLFRRTATAGEARFDFTFSYDSALPIPDQLSATMTLVALYGRGSLEIHARDGSRPDPMIFDVEPRELPPFIAVLHQLLGDLHLIEEWLGSPLTLPSTISGNDMNAIAETAYIIRNGQSKMSFGHIALKLDSERAEPFKQGVPGVLGFSTALDVNLFGSVVRLGHLVGEIPASDVKVSMTPVEGADPSAWLVRLEPATDEARNRIARFQRGPGPGSPPQQGQPVS